MKRFITAIIGGCILLGLIGWGALAIYYSNISSASLRTILSWMFALGSVAILLFLRPRWPSWKLLVNGYLDERLYETGAIDNSLPLAELKARSHINERAKAADDAPDFSQKIRAGLPGMGE